MAEKIVGLTEHQTTALKLLRRDGKWTRHAYHWTVVGGPGETRKILEALVKKGLVRKDERAVYRPVTL